MALKRLHAVVAVIGIVLASGAAWWWQNRTPSAGVAVADASVSAAPGTTSGATGAAGDSARARATGRPGAGGAAAGGPGAGGSQGPVPVEVGRVERVRVEEDATAVGSVRSNQGVMLRPEVSGRVQRLGFRDGERVRQGQVLVQLDDSLQRAQLQQAEAQAGIARTSLRRNRELQSQGFVSASAVEQAEANLKVAEAQVALARAQLQRLRISAPFDGVAGIRSVNVGDYVREGADLVAVEDLRSVWVDFRLPERYSAQLRAGQDVEVMLDALPGRRFNGKVMALDSQLDANGRSLLVRARMDNADGTLRSGMFARARVVLGVKDNALVVPEEALVPQGGKQYVIKLVDGPKGKVSQRVEAQLGLRLPGKAQILQGLEAGDMVVTAGQNRLLRGDGQAVRVVQLGAGRENSGVPASAASAPAPARAPSASAA